MMLVSEAWGPHFPNRFVWGWLKAVVSVNSGHYSSSFDTKLYDMRTFTIARWPKMLTQPEPHLIISMCFVTPKRTFSSFPATKRHTQNNQNRSLLQEEHQELIDHNEAARRF
eukprot:scaffold1376_cov125-Cylindrotheca_fusiformis.AAC.15